MSERTDFVLKETAEQLGKIISALVKVDGESGEDQSFNLPAWNKNTSLPQMDSYWVFSVTVNDDDGTGDKTEECLVGLLENPDDNYDNWPELHILAIVKDSNAKQHLWAHRVDEHQLEVAVRQGNQTYDVYDYMFKTDPDRWTGNDNNDIPASLHPTWRQVTAAEAATIYANRTCTYYKIEVSYGPDPENKMVERFLARTDNSTGDVEILKSFKAEGNEESYVSITPLPEEWDTGVIEVANEYSDDDLEYWGSTGQYQFSPLATPYNGSDGISSWDGSGDDSSWPNFIVLTIEQAAEMYNS